MGALRGPVQCGGGPVCGMFGGHFADGGVVVGLWVLVLCLGFPYREAYLLGFGGCRGLHHLGVYASQNLLGMLPGGWGLWDSGFLFPCSMGVSFLVGCLQAFFCTYSSASWLLGCFAGGALPLYCMGFFGSRWFREAFLSSF